jgi:tetratricopeptide (TPR) repeat protein
MAATNDPKVVEVVVRSHLETRAPPREIIAELDRAFVALKDKDENHKPPLDTPELAAARAFAAEKARVIAEVLKDDRGAVVSLLGAAAEDARAGTKRTHGVHYFLGQLAARHGELEIAAHHFQHAVRNAPQATIGDAYGGLMTVLLTARKPAEIKRLCLDALRDIDRLPLAPHYFNYYLSGALADLGDERGALAAADAAILAAAVSDMLTVRLQKVRVLNTLGRWDDAIAFAKKLYDEFEGRADRDQIRYSLAGAYWGAKKYAEAEAELRAILESDPDNAAAANDLGFHLADLGRDLPEAERLVRHAIAADRRDRKKAGAAQMENAAYTDSLGWVLFRQGKLPEALAELERAAALHAGAIDPVVWDHLGDVLFRSGEKARAKAAWEKAGELYLSEGPGGRGRRDGRLDEVKRKLKRVQ